MKDLIDQIKKLINWKDERGIPWGLIIAALLAIMLAIAIYANVKDIFLLALGAFGWHNRQPIIDWVKDVSKKIIPTKESGE